MPWPKKATDMITMTHSSLRTKLAAMMVEARSRPATIGALRAILAEPERPRRTSET